MHQEVVAADNVDGAVEKVLKFLEDTNEAHGIYFDGWQGLGASAVLRTIAKRLVSAKTMPPKLKFHKIIHIDCSKWKNRREMQRIIAEQLMIQEAMNILDRQDDEDDFSGIDECSRAETKDAARSISSFLTDKRFLVLFHNGSDYEFNISDMANFGLPLYIQFNVNKMLWTFRGRFRLSPKVQEMVQSADVFLYSQLQNQGPSNQNHWWNLLLEESKEISLCINRYGFIVDPIVVAHCWLYISKLNCIGSHIIDYCWSVHASNYWISDGIIDCENNTEAWELADILHHEMPHDWEDDPGLFYLMGNNEQWLCTVYFDSTNYGFLEAPEVAATVSSFFLAAQQLDTDERRLEYFGMIKSDRSSFLHNYNDMFRHSENLRVLKLSRCCFTFDSPPFLCCKNLRFLGLDYCQDLGIAREIDVHSWTCLKCLWVLDISYTQWILTQEMIDHMVNLRELNVKGAIPSTIGHVQKWPNNICKLRLIKPTTDKVPLCFSNTDKIEILDLSGNTAMKDFPDLSKMTTLKTVIVDGCVSLECVSNGRLPASLETFSLDAAAAKCPMDVMKVSKVSLRGCSRLMQIHLRGLPKLEELDLSNTSVKIVDFSIMHSPLLKRLFLLGCQRLRAIRWSNDGEPKLHEVQINTTGIQQTGGVDKLFESHIVLTDARLLHSLQQFIRRMRHLHLHVSSPITNCSNQEGRNYRTDINKHNNEMFSRRSAVNKYNDILNVFGDANATLVMWPCTQLPAPPKLHGSCNMEIISSTELQELVKTLAPIIDIADTLFVHDDFWITRIPGSNWGWLKWCRIERCPRLHSVFTFGDSDDLTAFSLLEIFWASNLRMAQYIWSKGFCLIHGNSFRVLCHIHLESCPQLIHVLPLSVNLPSLENIEILYCTNLTKIFPLNTRYLKEIVTNGSAINFPMLKRIHLHELPNLEQICESKILCAPLLNTVKVRGCWNLKRLPAIPGWRGKPTVDCEKDWWDNLEWEGSEAWHHPLNYKKHHPHHYKRKLCKNSVLR